MSETTDPTAQPGQAMPPLVVNVQYIKDLSFEVPNAPEIYATLRSQPAVQINLDVQARALQDGQNVFEVVLAVKAEARETAAPGRRHERRRPAWRRAPGVHRRVAVCRRVHH